MISYAQNFEDVLLNRVFGGMNYGFYVDIGAYHPTDDSVTKAFYDRGWSGINIEPGEIFDELATARPRDINLRLAVHDHSGEVTFAQHPGWYAGLSHVQESASHGIAVPSGQNEVRVHSVACDTLTNILNIHAHRRPIAFLKIDAEGSELAIIRSTDWRAIRPTVLVIEATMPMSMKLDNQDWEPILLEQGYVRAYFDGVNCFYVPEEEAPALLRYFEAPVNILDGVRRHEDEVRRAELQARQQEVLHLTAERDAMRAMLDAKNAEVHALTAERDALRAREAELTQLRAEHGSLRAAFEQKIAEATRLLEERDRWFAALETNIAEAERLTAERDAALAAQAGAAQIGDERDALRAALAEKMVEAAQLAETVRTLETRLAPPSEETQAVTPVTLPRARIPLGRRAAKAVYRLVRPVVRPLAWRLRTFLTGDLAVQIRGIDARIEAVAHTQAHGAPALPPIQPTIIQMRDDGAAHEMRRLAAEMERTLLTLALERPPEPWPHAGVEAEPPPVASSFSTMDKSSHSSPEARMIAAR